MPVVILTSASASPWVRPSDFPGTADKVECVGAGGNGSGRVSTTRGGSGGGGGAYVAATNYALAANPTFSIGAAGSQSDTTFDSSAFIAKAGTAGTTTPTAGAGGLASGSTVPAGGQKQSGGSGIVAPTSNAEGGGGGGAGGPHGDGSTAPSNIGGASDNSTVSAPAAGTNGNSGTQWNNGAGTIAGTGTGGSGFASGTHNGTTGGAFGGGGSGASDGSNASSGGNGGGGLIVITYTSTLSQMARQTDWPNPKPLIHSTAQLAQFYVDQGTNLTTLLRNQYPLVPPGDEMFPERANLQPKAPFGAQRAQDDVSQNLLNTLLAQQSFMLRTPLITRVHRENATAAALRAQLDVTTNWVLVNPPPPPVSPMPVGEAEIANPQPRSTRFAQKAQDNVTRNLILLTPFPPVASELSVPQPRATRVAQKAQDNVTPDRLTTLLAPSAATPFGGLDWPNPLPRRHSVHETTWVNIALPNTTFIYRIPVFTAFPTRLNWAAHRAQEDVGQRNLALLQPGAVASPIIPSDWPLPPQPLTRVAQLAQAGVSQDLLNTLLATTATAVPFAGLDWPNPSPRLHRSAQIAQDNVRSASTQLLLAANALPPGIGRDNPNPRPVPRGTPDFGAPNLVLSAPAPSISPFAQTDWPNPRDVSRSASLIAQSNVSQDLLNTLLAPLPPGNPFIPYDWPSPSRTSHRAAQIAQDGVTQDLSNTLRFVAPPPLPFRQLDWPNPRNHQPRQPNFTWPNVALPSGVQYLFRPPLVTRAQGRREIAPALSQADVRRNLALLQPQVAGTPIIPYDWPTPVRPSHRVACLAQDAVSQNLLDTLLFVAPLPPLFRMPLITRVHGRKDIAPYRSQEDAAQNLIANTLTPPQQVTLPAFIWGNPDPINVRLAALQAQRNGQPFIISVTPPPSGATLRAPLFVKVHGRPDIAARVAQQDVWTNRLPLITPSRIPSITWGASPVPPSRVPAILSQPMGQAFILRPLIVTLDGAIGGELIRTIRSDGTLAAEALTSLVENGNLGAEGLASLRYDGSLGGELNVALQLNATTAAELLYSILFNNSLAAEELAGARGDGALTGELVTTAQLSGAQAGELLALLQANGTLAPELLSTAANAGSLPSELLAGAANAGALGGELLSLTASVIADGVLGIELSTSPSVSGTFGTELLQSFIQDGRIPAEVLKTTRLDALTGAEVLATISQDGIVTSEALATAVGFTGTAGEMISSFAASAGVSAELLSVFTRDGVTTAEVLAGVAQAAAAGAEVQALIAADGKLAGELSGTTISFLSDGSMTIELLVKAQQDGAIAGELRGALFVISCIAVADEALYAVSVSDEAVYAVTTSEEGCVDE